VIDHSTASEKLVERKIRSLLYFDDCLKEC